MPRVGLSLGSNLGDRLANLREAISRLAPVRNSDHLLLSNIYKTDPEGCAPDDPEFLNAAIEMETNVPPEELLDFVKRIEREMGRPERYETNSPRVIDLDILYYENLVLKTDRLEIPHPRMSEREFVLRPLADIRPDLVPDLSLESDEVRKTNHSLVSG